MRITAFGLAAAAVGGLAVVSPSQAQSWRGQPSGSYAATCRDARISGGVLTARCLDARGRLHDSSLGYTTCRGDIANINGALTCPGGVPGRSDSYYPQGRDVRRAPAPAPRDRDRGYGPGGSQDRGGYGR